MLGANQPEHNVTQNLNQLQLASAQCYSPCLLWNVASSFNSALVSFLERAQLSVVIGDADDEWYNRLELLTRTIQRQPPMVQQLLHAQVFDALCRIGYTELKADTIVNDIARRGHRS